MFLAEFTLIYTYYNLKINIKMFNRADTMTFRRTPLIRMTLADKYVNCDVQQNRMLHPNQ